MSELAPEILAEIREHYPHAANLYGRMAIRDLLAHIDWLGSKAVEAGDAPQCPYAVNDDGTPARHLWEGWVCQMAEGHGDEHVDSRGIRWPNDKAA